MGVRLSHTRMAEKVFFRERIMPSAQAPVFYRTWFGLNPGDGPKGVAYFKNTFDAYRVGLYIYHRLTLVGRGFRFHRYVGAHYLRQN
jgi:hypothetical protein